MLRAALCAHEAVRRMSAKQGGKGGLINILNSTFSNQKFDQFYETELHRVRFWVGLLAAIVYFELFLIPISFLGYAIVTLELLAILVLYNYSVKRLRDGGRSG